MKYIDLHCDALTSENALQVTKETLAAGGCLLQCFAAFVPEQEGRFDRAIALADAFDALCSAEGYHAVTRVSELSEGVNALFTIEGGGAIEGDLKKLETLYGRGARMMTLVWNQSNELGFPNFSGDPFKREKKRGLTETGRAAVEKMLSLPMLVDVSHGSDKLVEDVAELCARKGAPFLASHSGACAVHPWTRNLEDLQIRRIAESGGVIGLDFVADFLSDDHTPEGQRAALLSHAEHILNVGGENVLALGSDFDGMPENSYLKNPSYLPDFLDALERRFGTERTEKIAFRNAKRVLEWLG